MRIVIIGLGTIGRTVLKSLSGKGHQVVMIDVFFGEENLPDFTGKMDFQEKANELFDEWMADENFEIVENEEFKQFLLTDEMEWTPYTQQFDEE